MATAQIRAAQIRADKVYTELKIRGNLTWCYLGARVIWEAQALVGVQTDYPFSLLPGLLQLNDQEQTRDKEEKRGSSYYHKHAEEKRGQR